MLTKTELRKAVRQLKKQHTQEELKALSTVITGKLLELPCIKEATTVMLYCSLPDEVYTMDMIHRLHGEGKKIVLPKVISDCEMELREYDGDAETMIGLSKEFFNSYLQTGRKIGLGCREKSNVSLIKKDIPASTRYFPKQTGVDDNGNAIFTKGETKVPAYESIKVISPCPSHIK